MNFNISLRAISFIPVPSAVADLVLAAHHAGRAALGAQELPLLMGRMGQLPHLDLASPAEHEASPFRTICEPLNSLQNDEMASHGAQQDFI